MRPSRFSILKKLDLPQRVKRRLPSVVLGLTPAMLLMNETSMTLNQKLTAASIGVGTIIASDKLTKTHDAFANTALTMIPVNSLAYPIIAGTPFLGSAAGVFGSAFGYVLAAGKLGKAPTLRQGIATAGMLGALTAAEITGYGVPDAIRDAGRATLSAAAHVREAAKSYLSSSEEMKLSESEITEAVTLVLDTYTLSKERRAFYQEVMPLALVSEQQYQFPAEILVSLAVVETGSLDNILIQSANNFGGIKAVGDDKYVEITANGASKPAKWRVYDSRRDGILGIADHIAQNPIYARAVQAQSNPEFLKGLSKWAEEGHHLPLIHIIATTGDNAVLSIVDDVRRQLGLKHPYVKGEFIFNEDALTEFKPVDGTE